MRPFGARIHPHFQLRNVDRAIAYFGWPFCRDDAPTTLGPANASRLIQQLLLVRRQRVGLDTLEERLARTLLELVSV